MNIWEDVYSKHKEGKKVTVNPLADLNQPLSDTLNQPTAPGDPSCSFEELYYRTSKPQPPPQPQSQPVNQGVPPREPQPSAPAPAPSKPVKSRFIPRIQSDKLTVPYPAILAKMRYSLSDTWANILVETKQNIETLLVCGAARKEGATFISYHLAMFLSKEFSMKILYVDTNLGHAAIPRVQNLPGLYSFVSEGKELAPLIVQTEYPGFYMLPSGAGKVAKSVSSNMLTREPIQALLDFSRDNFALTIIDGQPLTSSPVMIEFARVVDMTLLVCRYGYSRQEVSKLAIDKLQKFGITSIGVILNDRKFPVPQKVYQLMG